MFMKRVPALVAMLGIAMISEASILTSDSLVRSPLDPAMSSGFGGDSPPVIVSTVCKSEMRTHFRLPENTILAVLREKFSCP